MSKNVSQSPDQWQTLRPVKRTISGKQPDEVIPDSGRLLGHSPGISEQAGHACENIANDKITCGVVPTAPLSEPVELGPVWEGTSHGYFALNFLICCFPEGIPHDTDPSVVNAFAAPVPSPETLDLLPDWEPCFLQMSQEALSHGDGGVREALVILSRAHSPTQLGYKRSSFHMCYLRQDFLSGAVHVILQQSSASTSVCVSEASQLTCRT